MKLKNMFGVYKRASHAANPKYYEILERQEGAGPGPSTVHGNTSSVDALGRVGGYANLEQNLSKILDKHSIKQNISDINDRIKKRGQQAGGNRFRGSSRDVNQTTIDLTSGTTKKLQPTHHRNHSLEASGINLYQSNFREFPPHPSPATQLKPDFQNSATKKRSMILHTNPTNRLGTIQPPNPTPTPNFPTKNSRPPSHPQSPRLDCKIFWEQNLASFFFGHFGLQFAVPRGIWRIGQITAVICRICQICPATLKIKLNCNCSSENLPLRRSSKMT